MMNPPSPFSQIRRIGIVVVTIAACLLHGAPLFAARHARLSRGLNDHLASGSKASVDVIVHGTPNEVKALAARHGLTIARGGRSPVNTSTR